MVKLWNHILNIWAEIGFCDCEAHKDMCKRSLTWSCATCRFTRWPSLSVHDLIVCPIVYSVFQHMIMLYNISLYTITLSDRVWVHYNVCFTRSLPWSCGLIVCTIHQEIMKSLQKKFLKTIIKQNIKMGIDECNFTLINA